MFLYIDPGTGSMLFSLAIGILSVLWFAVQKVYMKVKYLVPGKKTKNGNKYNLVIYSEDKRYWPVFCGICDELEKRKVQTEYLAGSEDDPVFEQNYAFIKATYIGTGNKAYAKLNFLNCKVCLATTPGLDVYQWKRSKNVDWYVHVLHALRGVTTYRMFGTEFYDAILTSAEVDNKSIRDIERKRKSPEKELVVVGSPLMDQLREKYQMNNNKSRHEGYHILLAPSWGDNSIFNRFGDVFLDSLIETGYDITIRPHPQSFISELEMIERFQKKYPESEKLHWNRDADNFEVLCNTDLLISDYSGVIFDFAFVFDRPVIYANVQMDWSVYDAFWCDESNYHLESQSQIGVELAEDDIGKIKEIIDKMMNDNSYSESRKRVREESWAYQGEAAKRVVDYLTTCLDRFE